ncbi:MAG TPA: T9SS type A sorting domain-containing protein, partial [Bacteroidia bacterium]|nr:T9SS type A sorting domain-containing protein [Bacteroidia bacterium]
TDTTGKIISNPVFAPDPGNQATLVCTLGGINQFSNNTQVKIYPNPAQNKITIDATDVVDVKLFDMLGKQITTSKENQIDISNFTNGIYFIQVKTNTSMSTQKIIVQH